MPSLQQRCLLAASVIVLSASPAIASRLLKVACLAMLAMTWFKVACLAIVLAIGVATAITAGSLLKVACLAMTAASRVLVVACLLVAGSGCAQLHRTPDQCAYALDRCELVRELDCILDCNCPECSMYRQAPPCGETIDGSLSGDCGGNVCSLSGDCGGMVVEESCSAPAPRACGPPLVRYRPPEPPTFLPVPTQPVIATTPADVPGPARGSVEVGYRQELTFPGGL